MTALRTATAPRRTEMIPVIRGASSASKSEALLAAQVAEWITLHRLAPAHLAPAVAGSLVTSGGLDWVTREFGDGHPSETLRLSAVSLAADADLDADEWAAENRPYFTRDAGLSWPTASRGRAA